MVPIYSAPVHGAFGSEFHTIARAGNKSDTPLAVYGIDTNCLLIDPPQSPFSPFRLNGGIDIHLPSGLLVVAGAFLLRPEEHG